MFRLDICHGSIQVTMNTLFCSFTCGRMHSTQHDTDAFKIVDKLCKLTFWWQALVTWPVTKILLIFFIFTCSCLHLTNRDLAFICFLFSLLLAILLLCWQYLPKQINFLCPAKIPRFVRERSWIWFSLIRVCFLLNKALRLFRVCAEDSLCSLPVCVNLSMTES